MMHSEHAERALLGTLLTTHGEIDTVETLETSALYLDSNRRILTTIRILHTRGDAVDIVTVSEELRRRKELDAIGGIPYLAMLSEGLPRNSKAAPYANLIRERAAHRSVKALCDSVAQRAEEGSESSDDLLHELQSSALMLQAAGVQLRPTPISELMVPYWEEFMRKRNYTGQVLGVPTGIPRLDHDTSGWRDGELTYVGALPGRGKTSFLLQEMYVAAQAGFGVGCISLEMRAMQLINRLAIMNTKLSADKFRDPRVMTMMEVQAVKTALFSSVGLGDLKIQITDQSGLRPAQIAALARQMHANGARIIFLDFVQIIQEDGRDRREAINRVSAALRDTCKSLNIPFVVASQLARRDADPNRRPTLQDLRESGNLEQDAHNVLLLYRPKNDDGDWSGQDEILIDKQREGMTGVVHVRYDENTLAYVGRE